MSGPHGHVKDSAKVRVVDVWGVSWGVGGFGLPPWGEAAAGHHPETVEPETPPEIAFPAANAPTLSLQR
jgi:hypothetical protein